MLASMFSGRIPTWRDADGRFFIDRDGRLFHHILNYLRDGKYPLALLSTERCELEREASYFGLEALAAHLRADLKPRASTEDAAAQDDTAGLVRVLSAKDAADRMLNRILEEWPEFPKFLRGVMGKLYEVGGLHHEDSADGSETSGLHTGTNSGVMLDESLVASLQTESIAVTQVELAHIDHNSKAWRWSDRKTGVNSVLRTKLLRCHLQRLGYTCSIVPVLDKKDVSAYVLQVELPIPS